MALYIYFSVVPQPTEHTHPPQDQGVVTEAGKAAENFILSTGEAEEEILEFPNEKKVFYLALQEPVEASEIKIRIQSSYAGERWEDNCISEIEVYE